jgi:hypothetical protein
VLRSFPVLVMVAAYSRFIAAVMIPSRVTGDLLAGIWQLIATQIGGFPRSLLWDNESGIGQQRRLAHGVAGFCVVLGTRLIQARPYDPETKGVVERTNGYLGTSFLPGRTLPRRPTSTPNCRTGWPPMPTIVSTQARERSRLRH